MRKYTCLPALLTSAAILLSACGGSGGSTSTPTTVVPTPPPSPPLVSVSRTVDLPSGDANCFQGGTRTDTGLDDNRDGSLSDDEVDTTTFTCNTTQANETENFTRISTFPVCRQQDANCDTSVVRRAEILDVSADGNTLIYTDAPRQALGFVDITNARDPQASGTRDLPGVPTSVAVKGDFAIVTIDRAETSGPSNGSLEIVNLNTRTIVRSIALAGNPDSVAVSPDGTRALVAVENPNLNGDDQPPTPGFLVALDISNDDPSAWAATNITLTGLADINADDPEPEFVDINADNIAVVSLQTNNHFVLVDLVTNAVTFDVSAGRGNVDQIDATEGGIDRIDLSQNLVGVLREPDGVAWINTTHFMSANEGDDDGGTRGFSVFDTSGALSFDAGNALEYEAVRLGHYSESRSEQKGNEPEGAEVGVFGSDRYAFVGSERGDLIFVYDMADPTAPLAIQSLPTPASPEGIKAIPSRNLLAVAGEEDDRGNGMRSAISLYEYGVSRPDYPSIHSDIQNGKPIPWGAISGLAVDPNNDTRLYAVEDGTYDANRIFKLDRSLDPVLLDDVIQLTDGQNLVASLSVSGESSDRNRFDAEDRADLINSDGTFNFDLEGIHIMSNGDIWAVSEGDGTADNTLFEPIDAVNLLLSADNAGELKQLIRLPANVDAIQNDNGFSGVAEENGTVYVTFQRPWGDETRNRVGRFNDATKTWSFVFYETDAPESQNGGSVNVNGITSLGNGRFRVLESDTEGGPDAAVKRLYDVDLATVADNGVVAKTLARDLIATGDLPVGNGFIPNKIEGIAVLSDGQSLVINNNEGLQSNIGETRLVVIE